MVQISHNETRSSKSWIGVGAAELQNEIGWKIALTKLAHGSETSKGGTNGHTGETGFSDGSLHRQYRAGRDLYLSRQIIPKGRRVHPRQGCSSTRFPILDLSTFLRRERFLHAVRSDLAFLRRSSTVHQISTLNAHNRAHCIVSQLTSMTRSSPNLSNKPLVTCPLATIQHVDM